MFRHNNRSGGLRKNYMTRKYPRRANPFRRRGLVFREIACWYCIPGNKQKFIQSLELSKKEHN